MFKKIFDKKGVTGKIMTIVMSLIIALIALALLWGFLSMATPNISKAIESSIDGFKKMLCEKLGVAWLCGIGEWWGQVT